MALALDLARNGTGWVDPNPLVGAVAVRGGEILAVRTRSAWPSTMPTRMASI